MAELRRHYAGHRRHAAHARGAVDAAFVCCGVHVADAGAYGVDSIDGVDNVHEFGGALRVGGCWKVFSRKDALLRHLRNTKTGCVTYLDLYKGEEADGTSSQMEKGRGRRAAHRQ